jgi:hypothetical protein
MQKLIIEESLLTPAILFDNENGILEIRGTSTPEDSFTYYKPIFNWLDEYTAAPAKITKLNFIFDYFNTSSSKCVVNILKKVERIFHEGHEVEIFWYYHPDDKDMVDVGNDFQSIMKAPFIMKEIEKQGNF